MSMELRGKVYKSARIRTARRQLKRLLVREWADQVMSAVAESGSHPRPS